MTDLTPAQLTATTEIADADLLMLYIVADTVMRKIRWDAFLPLVIESLSDDILFATNNLSDVLNPSAARGNLGLGTAAVLAASALLQSANNLSEVADAAAARTNIAAAGSVAPAITGGMTFTGAVKANVNAVAAASIDVSVGEFHTKSISSNTTFTFTGATASKAQAFILSLTISSSATPTWPAAVKWSLGVAPTLANGLHVLGFITTDGGTTWQGFVGGREFA